MLFCSFTTNWASLFGTFTEITCLLLHSMIFVNSVTQFPNYPNTYPEYGAESTCQRVDLSVGRVVRTVELSGIGRLVIWSTCQLSRVVLSRLVKWSTHPTFLCTPQSAEMNHGMYMVCNKSDCTRELRKRCHIWEVTYHWLLEMSNMRV